MHNLYLLIKKNDLKTMVKVNYIASFLLAIMVRLLRIIWNLNMAMRYKCMIGMEIQYVE